MAATRSVLRASAQRLIEPGAVLERVNEHLVPDIPENMFVTCLYGVLELDTGRLVFANAGHNLPMVATGATVTELYARGMPLGLMPGMDYEETEAVLAPGAQLLLYSDGVTEAHDPAREMFGSGRLSDLMARSGSRDVGSMLSHAARRRARVRRRGGGAGGRHHPGCDPARLRRAADGILDRQRGRQRARGDHACSSRHLPPPGSRLTVSSG